MKTYSTLAEIVQKHGGLIQTGPFGSQLHESDYQENGVPVVMPTDINNGRIDESAIARISEVKASQLSRHKLRVNMIVYPRRGEITKCAFVELSQDGFICGTGCIKIELPNDVIYPEFFYYYLNSREVTGWLKNNAVGSTMLNLSAGIFKRIQVPDIDFTTQKNISAILSNYVQLIDTNRRRIQLLEESARLLFREWFVYFKFSNHEKVKIVDGVPEGWKKEKINKLVSLLGGHAFKGTSYQQDGKYGIITIKNVQQGSFIPECTDYLEETPNAMRKHCFLSNGDILMSLTGNVGRVCLVYGENFLLNQRVAKIESQNKIPKSFIYWMFDDPIMQKRIENLSYGSAQQNLSPIKLGEQKVILPPDPLLERFDKIVSLINIEIIKLLIQNQKLAQARDLLLPRLMSGAIEV